MNEKDQNETLQYNIEYKIETIEKRLNTQQSDEKLETKTNKPKRKQRYNLKKKHKERKLFVIHFFYIINIFEKLLYFSKIIIIKLKTLKIFTLFPQIRKNKIIHA